MKHKFEIGIIEDKEGGKVYYTCKFPPSRVVYPLVSVGGGRYVLGSVERIFQINILHTSKGAPCVEYVMDSGFRYTDETLLFKTEVDARAEMYRRNKA